ncbi:MULTISPECIES: DUF2162 domain-containing protein [Methanosphaera]|jgi:predicted transporter|uniref:Predicted transporter n=2 Tax=Methanosphaera stadtmanae TaxID=2317 RepID=Q2NFB5_METST|nr:MULTISPECIES: DUF2162 domain-containing protein [Methanosphaera]ABC57488.1 predicted transporter [Methanosphaera stadtmanae DSM 3091]MEE0489808.1 DUF2162 domain-containing protein [Methanosphaera stadtmanae]OEC88021.1 hypothetical protein A9758_00635 [Methanosphaera sp. A6]RAP02833.1 hypothetical protein CA615_05495 [Methanosphaera stadtmanae]RAP46852.1 MAG: hypothetical protein BZ132_05255 [Methanosphaera sp. DEW79]
MLEQFWQYGILAAVLIFGLKIGLALGFSGIEKKKVLLILVGYGVALTIFSYVLTPYTQQVYTFVYQYTSGIFACIAIVILITGFKTIYDWKVTGKDVGSGTCMAVVAPCPCCFGAILASIMLVAPIAGVSSITLGVFSSVALVLVMGITYFLSMQIVKRMKQPYPIVLGNFMIFIGLYFVLCLIILPNMAYITTGTSIEIQSIENVSLMIVSVLCLLIAGGIFARNKSYFLEK